MKLHPLGLLALAFACQKPAAKSEEDVKVAAEVAGAAAAQASAAGGAVVATGKVTACPNALGGTEQVHRVISKECGVVPVTEDYHVDGGSLTLEAGSSLSFKDGAGLHIGRQSASTLIVQGTAQTPVVLTSAGDKAAGAWRGVTLYGNADGSQLEGLVIEYAGNEDGALVIDAEDVTVKGVKIRETPATAVRIGDGGGLKEFTGNEIRKVGNKTVIDAPARAIGGLGGKNRFDAGAQVRVRGGTVEASARWQDIGAPLLIAGEVGLDGKDTQRITVELAPGLELRFTEAGLLTVGAQGPATLIAKGTSEAPITFTGQERKAGGWRNLGVHVHGEATLEHVVLEFGGKDDEAGVVEVRGGQLSLSSTTFRSNRMGVTADDGARIPVFADNKFAATPIAAVLPAALIGALGEGNAYDRECRIKTRGGQIKGKVTWIAQGVPVEFAEEIRVEAGELTLAAGVELIAGAAAKLTIGDRETAALKVEGTFESPVTIGPAGSSWPGITLASQARGNVLEHLVLTSVSAASAIEVAGEAEVELRSVTCSKCSGAVIGWGCGAKVTSSQVLAADGTPAIDRKPEGC